MSKVTLAQLQTQLSLSDATLCVLLRENKLPLSIDGERGLLIDITDSTMTTLIDAIRSRERNLPAPRQEVLEERIANIISEMFSRVTDHALRIALAESKPAKPSE